MATPLVRNMKESSPEFPESSPLEKQAAKWIARMDRGLTSEEQDEYIEWLTEDERHRQAMANYQWAWGEIDRLAGVQTSHHEKIDPDILAPKTEVEPIYKSRRSLIAWFATVPLAAVVALTVLYLVRPETERLEPRVGQTEFEPAIELMARIEQQALEDGSKVYINRGSSVEISYTSDERRVYLTKGEANFEVAKDPNRPFIVNVAGVDVRAVGTIFSVKLSDDLVDVIVTEGKVNVKPVASVFSSEKPEVDSFLEMGQRAKVRLKSENPMVEIVTMRQSEIENAIRWQPRLLDFESTPLREIIDEFNNSNPIQVTLGDPALETFLISSTFWSDNVEGFVRLMESTFGVKAEWGSDREIVLGKHPQSVQGVKTNAVVGQYYPQSALRIMLEDTILTIDYDEETGAYGVMRNEL